MKREKCKFSVRCISVITIVNLLCVTFSVDYALVGSIRVPFCPDLHRGARTQHLPVDQPGE